VRRSTYCGGLGSKFRIRTTALEDDPAAQILACFAQSELPAAQSYADVICGSDTASRGAAERAGWPAERERRYRELQRLMSRKPSFFNTVDSENTNYIEATINSLEETMPYIQTSNDAAYREQQRDADRRWEQEQREAEQARELENKAREGKLEWSDLGYGYPEPPEKHK
jgi:hypothetical protein